MLAPNQVDLAVVEPKGRVDVLAYKGVEWLTRYMETQHGIEGLWDALKPEVNKLIVANVTGIEIPVEVKMILSIIQSNMGKKQGA